jgi:hypothetical protein
MREAYLVIVSLLPNVVVDGLNVEVKLNVSLTLLLQAWVWLVNTKL